MVEVARLAGSGGYMRPCSAAAASRSPVTTPAPATAIRLAASISRCLNRSMPSTMPRPSGTGPPTSPLPAPRVVSEVPVSAQSFTTAATSSVLPGRTAASSGDSRKVASCVYFSSASPLTTWSGPTIACSRSSRSLISGDPREDAADPGGFTFADHDLGKDPVGGRLQLRVDLVGLDLDERLTLPDRLARLLQPAGDDAFLERIGEAWQREVHNRIGCAGLSQPDPSVGIGAGFSKTGVVGTLPTTGSS